MSYYVETMSSLDVFCEKIHDAHGPRWERGGICVACVAEMMDRSDVSAVRKRAALVSVMRVDAARELLYCEEQRRTHFISSLLKTLFSAVDSSLLDQTVQVLVQVTLDVPSQALLLFILDQTHSRWSDGERASLSSVMFLGKLLDAHPALSQTLTSSRLCVLECVCSALLVSDEDVKAAVCYVMFRIWSSSAAVQTLPDTLRQRMCVLLLHTLSHTHTTALTVNCLGVVKQMCQYSDVVCVLMNLKDGGEDPLLYQPLPLILKKLLLSAQDSLQVVSVRCVCAVLIHAPLHFSSSFIQADLPEFLLEVISGGCSDVLLWSVFSCLLLLSEDPLFFSQCHAVYGVEPLVRSLKETLGKSNTEVQKKGLELLTVILDRQPAAVRLFPTTSEFSAVCDVIVEGVASSCLQVSMCAVRAAAVLLRPSHQSSPVQLADVRRIVEVVMSKLTEQHHKHSRESCSGSKSVTAGVLLQTLTCFDAACRLVQACVCDSSLKDGVCSSQETLESVCVFLLHCCDAACIPAVTGVCERVSSPQVLQLFLSALSCQFSLCPDLMTSFSRKLAASGFIRLTLESKAQLCSGNRNVSLNQICCDFLLKLCMSLISQEHTCTSELQDVECVLQESLPSLCCCASDWLSVLSDFPQSLRNTQHCLIYLLHLSVLHGDRFLSDSAVFSAVLRFVSCVQDLPASVLSSVLYLLSVTQHAGPRLDTVCVSVLSRALSSCPPLFSLSLPLSVLSFIFLYPELSERFGAPALTGRLSEETEEQELLELIHTHPPALLATLAVACDGESAASRSAVAVLQCFLRSADSLSFSGTSDLCDQIRSVLLSVLQRHTHTDGLSVLLDVSSVIHSSAQREHTDFRLLYHVSNLAGKLDSSDSKLLLSVFNFLYCFLSVCPSHATDRAVSLLLGNVRLMELLEEVLSASSSSSLLCSCLLLLSSLTLLQHKHSAQVHRSVSVDLHQIIRRLAFSKRHTDTLLIKCSVRFMQVCLDVDTSALLCVCDAALQRPLTSADGALHPIGHSGAMSLMTALSALMLMTQDLMVSAALNCLGSLMGFLRRRSPDTAQHMVCQPWMRFLLFSLLSCDQRLRPAALQLLTQLVCFSGSVSHWRTEVESVCEETEKQGATNLTDDSTHTLRRMFTQCCALSPPGDLRMRMEAIQESLRHLPPSESSSRHMLRVGRVSVCLSDFTVSTQDL
ncbi:meiosis inhibitor protein 1-like isoform X1 [Carassius carassius]|uniref:meiosis inhibitor protein 1-like isoform X1 n=1 Tax=Carassius carassius TaxID=217509 RepID=UPI00286913E5|nr:meiosis inhibitor protein 1-like isoform X1 [Carassius carassius]